MVAQEATKHTPGPWVAALVMGPPSVPREERTTPSHYLISESGIGKSSHLANIAHVIGTGSGSEANSRLIASAPVMLDALCAVLVAYTEHEPSGEGPACCRACGFLLEDDDLYRIRQHGSNCAIGAVHAAIVAATAHHEAVPA